MVTICSTLSGKVALKHPTLGVLVREDGAIFNSLGGKQPIYRWTKGCNSHGYRVSRIGRKLCLVHRMVAESFIENIENKPTVDHINRDKSDNRVENLRWATLCEQQQNTKAVLYPKYGISFTKDPLLYNRVRKKARRQEHYALGEHQHRCPDGKIRWHKPGECPVEQVVEVS